MSNTTNPSGLGVIGLGSMGMGAAKSALRRGIATWGCDTRAEARQAFEQAHAFYERHGGITIVLARFMPFVRTFVPFVAGVAEMTRSKFTLYNVAGALLWVVGLLLAGYFFGNLPGVQTPLSKIIWALILGPGLIALGGAWRARRSVPADARQPS